MKCPHCNKELKDGPEREYETLLDHVCNPNMENYPLRPTWICECDKSKGLFWDMYGGVYIERSANFKEVWENAIDVASEINSN